MKHCNKLIKGLTVVLCISLLTGSSIIGYADDTDETYSDDELIQTLKDNIDDSDTDTAEDVNETTKDETVYVIAGADGEAEKVIVSDWIKNPNGETSIKDSSDLTDIKNIKGSETYTIDEDGMKIWDAEGNDIYYQGYSDKTLPVNVGITYTLDGETISPDDLAGRSGHVVIRFDFTNNEKKTVDINGEPTELYVPFVMATGLMLDNDSFSNVEVSNGKVINDGTRNIVMGIALPGLQSDLDMSDSDVDIPDHIEISADTTSFELSTTLTMATDDIFSFDGLDYDNIESSLDEKISELEDGIGQLTDGSAELYDGLSTLLSSTDTLISAIDQLTSGAEQLSSGSDQLKEGASKVNNGASDLNEGLAELDSYSGQLTDGTKELSDLASAVSEKQSEISSDIDSLYNGLSTLKTNSASLNSGAEEVENGANDLNKGASDLASGITDLQNGLSEIDSNSSSINSGASQLFDSILTSANTQLTSQLSGTGITIPELTQGNYSAVLSGLISELSDENARAQAYSTALAQVTETVEANRSLIESSIRTGSYDTIKHAVISGAGLTLTNDEYDAAVSGGVISQETADQINEGIESKISELVQTQIDTSIQQTMSSSSVTSQIEAAVTNASSTRSALQSLLDSLDECKTFVSGVKEYTSGVSSALTGTKKLSAGSTKLASGSEKLEKGAASLSSGLSSYTAGVDQIYRKLSPYKKTISSLMSDIPTYASEINGLNTGVISYTDGVRSALSGSSQLSSGTYDLYTGSVSLDSGAEEVSDGLKTLLSKCDSLSSGVGQLTSGSMELSTGMQELSDKVSKITSLYKNDLKGLFDRFQAIQQICDEYDNYSGKTDDMEGTVKFIYRTDSIEATDTETDDSSD